MVFERLKKVGFSPLLGNTSTGLLLAVFSSVSPLIIYFTKATPLDSYLWIWVFGGYSLLHLLLAKFLDPRADELDAANT